MNKFITLLGLVFIVAACTSTTTSPVGDTEIAQDIQEIESLEAELAELESIEEELNFDELEGLDEDLQFE